MNVGFQAEHLRPVRALISKFGRRYRAPLGLTFLAMVAQVALDVLEPLPMKVVIDNVLRHRPLRASGLGSLAWLADMSPISLLGVACSALLLFAAGSALLEYIWSARVAIIGQALAFDLRAALFRHVQRLSISFYQTRASGEIVHRITSDIASIQEMLVSLLTVFSVNVLMLVGVTT